MYHRTGWLRFAEGASGEASPRDIYERNNTIFNQALSTTHVYGPLRLANAVRRTPQS